MKCSAAFQQLLLILITRMSTKNVEITSGQCRSARALLGMTQTDLANRAGLGLSTVVDFEKSRREVSPEAVAALRQALEQAGLHFIPKNGGGVGVRLRV
jgi:DNA-binding XRE family transcriptional regulator